MLRDFRFQSLKRNKGLSAFLKPYCQTGFLFLFFALAAAAIFLKGKLFLHYDNFSHWALVVKRMLAVNRFPNFRDSLIMFPAYPLGSSVYIYYFARIVSTSESAQMLAQTFVMLACILPLFFFLKKNRPVGLLIILLAATFLLTYNIAVTDLLVDTLLPLAGMCGLVFAVLYCGKEASKGTVLYAACYSVFLISIKTSGIFFALLICIWLLRWMKNNSPQMRVFSVCAPFASLIIWNRHCEYAFDGAQLSKFSISFPNLSIVFSEKKADIISQIVKSMFRFSVTWKDAWLTVLLFLLLGIWILVCAGDLLGCYKKLSLFSAVLYIAYQIGLTQMYLFSMPAEEAAVLSENVRYSKSIIIAVIYILLILVMKTVSEMNTEKPGPLVLVSAAAAVSFFGFAFFSTGEIRSALKYTGDRSPDLRIWSEAVRKEYRIPPGSSYCILVPPSESIGYAYFMGRYLFWPEHMFAAIAEDESVLEAVTDEYILVYDENNRFISS